MDSNMTTLVFLGFFIVAVAQRYPEFFDKADLERLGFMNHRGNPNPVVRPYEDTNTYKQNYYESNKPALRNPVERNKDYDSEKRYINHIKYREMYDEFDVVDYRINKYDAWDEFKEYAEKLKQEAEYDPNHDWHDDMKKIIEWSRKLSVRQPNLRNPELSNRYPEARARPAPSPSPGMAGYWAESEDAQKQRKGPNIPPVFPGFMGKEKIDVAIQNLKKLQEKSVIEDNVPPILREQVQQNPITALPVKDNITATQNNYKSIPEVDDYNAPIKWVPINSNDTRDGLTKVTDLKTKRNKELIINGSIFVPVIDYSLERIGLTSTTPPVLTTASTALRSVIQNIDLKSIDETDWLIFEIALGGKQAEEECQEEGCQARCKRLGCESMCNGDTCSSGCLGSSCNTLCVGDGCAAKCDGLSCDAKCRGVGCTARCTSFSCNYSVNGHVMFGGGSWNAHYPQYNEANIRAQFVE